MEPKQAISWVLEYNEANPGSYKPESIVRLIRVQRTLGRVDALRQAIAQKYANGDGQIHEDKRAEAEREFQAELAAIPQPPPLPLDVLGDMADTPTRVVLALEPFMVAE